MKTLHISESTPDEYNMLDINQKSSGSLTTSNSVGTNSLNSTSLIIEINNCHNNSTNTHNELIITEDLANAIKDINKLIPQPKRGKWFILSTRNSLIYHHINLYFRKF